MTMPAIEDNSRDSAMIFSNHVLCPPALLLAVVSLALVWRWIDAAVFLLLFWAGMLRPIEGMRLVRGDVLLPSEMFSAERAVFLRIGSPKMKRLRARKEHVKITDLDIVVLLEHLFPGLPPDSLSLPVHALPVSVLAQRPCGVVPC